jgi:hypothetical protein
LFYQTNRRDEEEITKKPARHEGEEAEQAKIKKGRGALTQ